MPAERNFYDKSLLEAVEASSAELASFQKKLDEATADTKELENWLQSTGFCIDVYVDVQNNFYHQIGWDQIGGKWRLVVTYWEDNHNEPIVKALADSSARSRLACRQYLPLLTREITKFYTSIQEPESIKSSGYQD